MADRIPSRILRRRSAMLEAYLYFHARKLPKEVREQWCMAYLLAWASLGGTPEEVIR